MSFGGLMRWHLHLVLFTLSLCADYAGAQSWQRGSDLPNERGEGSAVVVQNKIYLVGGMQANHNPVSSIDLYDPSTDTWPSKSNPLATLGSRNRHHFTAVVWKNRFIYAVGGKLSDDATGKKWVDVYDTQSNTWSKLPDLPEVHWGGPAVVLGDRLHVFGGSKGHTATLKHHYSLDLNSPNSGWQTLPQLPAARVHAAGAACKGKVYLVGGEINHAHQGDRREVYAYNPSAGSWSSLAPLPKPRSHSEWATFCYQGEIWSVSGVDSSKTPRAQAEIYIYNIDNNRWRRFSPDLPYRFASPAARIYNNTLYVFGGGINNWFDAGPGLPRLRTLFKLNLDPVEQAPAAPSSLRVVTNGASAMLSWRDNSQNEQRFDLRRSAGGGGFALLAALGADTISHTDSGLSPGTYRYRIKACNNAGCSRDSNEVSAKIESSKPPTPPQPALPATPANLQARAADSKSIELAWSTRSSNETSFELERRKKNGVFASVASLDAGTKRHSDHGLQPNTIYQYRILARNNAGVSGYSNRAEARTKRVEIKANPEIKPKPNPMPKDEKGSPFFRHWKFDETQGLTAYDSSRSNQSAILKGPQRTSGVIGRALLFDGINDYVSAGRFDIPGNKLTLSAWIKPSRFNLPPEGRIISKANSINSQQHYFMLSTAKHNGKIRLRGRLRINGKTITIFARSGEIRANSWTHVSMTYDGNRIRLFQDGRLRASHYQPGRLDKSPSTPVWIGANPRDASKRPFAGIIDEVYVADRALSQQELLALQSRY